VEELLRKKPGGKKAPKRDIKRGGKGCITGDPEDIVTRRISAGGGLGFGRDLKRKRLVRTSFLGLHYNN